MSLVGSQFGKICITDILGQGGMGDVYIGFDEVLKRQVAVKVIKAGVNADDETRSRFIKEAEVLSALEHPHICRIYDFIAAEDCDLLVLELIQGQSLDCCADLDRQSKWRIAIQMADVLGAEVVAEGIEDAEDYRVLLEMGVRYGQGYLFGMPKPCSEDTMSFTNQDMAEGAEAEA